MTHEHDRLEDELAALRPVEPSAELTERIGQRLAATATAIAVTKADGTRRVPGTIWLAVVGAIAAGVLIAVALWRGGENSPEADTPTELAQPTLAAALDDSLPSVWSYRSALTSSDALDQLLDKHARLAPSPGESVQTRGFGPVTMDLNSRLGGL
jgi:hypothetical protein